MFNRIQIDAYAYQECGLSQGNESNSVRYPIKDESINEDVSSKVKNHIINITVEIGNYNYDEMRFDDTITIGELFNTLSKRYLLSYGSLGQVSYISTKDGKLSIVELALNVQLLEIGSKQLKVSLDRYVDSENVRYMRDSYLMQITRHIIDKSASAYITKTMVMNKLLETLLNEKVRKLKMVDTMSTWATITGAILGTVLMTMISVKLGVRF